MGGIWLAVVALVAAFVIAAVTTPAGVAGAVLLLPFQVSVLGTPSPSATPTNLLYNVVACPGGGLVNQDGTVTLRGTRVAGNTPDNCEPPGTISSCTG